MRNNLDCLFKIELSYLKYIQDFNAFHLFLNVNYIKLLMTDQYKS